MNRNEYNGWTNYETWVVKLWMDNDAANDSYYREQAQSVYDEAKATQTFSRADVATIAFADFIRVEHEERQSKLMPDAGVFTDLLNAAMTEVDWHEIAAHYIDDGLEEAK